MAKRTAKVTGTNNDATNERGRLSQAAGHCPGGRGR